MIRAVIFDLDGVLVTTDEMHYRAWKKLADEEGIHFDRTINSRLRGVSRMESLEVLLERAERTYSPEEKRAMAERKNGYYCGFLADLTRDALLPGAIEMLVELKRRGVPMAIGSSSKNTPTIMERVGLGDYFEAIADGNQIEASKPDPEVFLLAARMLGAKPEECLVVEDAVAGVEAAKRAGMAVLGIGESPIGAEFMARDLSQIAVDDLLDLKPQGP